MCFGRALYKARVSSRNVVRKVIEKGRFVGNGRQYTDEILYINTQKIC